MENGLTFARTWFKFLLPVIFRIASDFVLSC